MSQTDPVRDIATGTVRTTVLDDRVHPAQQLSIDRRGPEPIDPANSAHLVHAPCRAEAAPDPFVEHATIEFGFRRAHKSLPAGDPGPEKAVEHSESRERERLAEERPVRDLEEEEERAAAGKMIDFSMHRVCPHEADAGTLGFQVIKLELPDVAGPPPHHLRPDLIDRVPASRRSETADRFETFLPNHLGGADGVIRRPRRWVPTLLVLFHAEPGRDPEPLILLEPREQLFEVVAREV